ncbi:MAG: lysophospholipid acyltransferase family protein [Deltaproteobacteria bacterium]|nr:lysophospholipid acyltransferase family protein [Deltaproteobacteria bacterium]
MPLSVALALGRALAWIWYHLIPIRRRVARENLARAMPELSAEQQRQVIRGMFRHLAMGGVEMLRLPGLTQELAENLVEHEGLEIFEEARALGRGVIVVTGHFGNFDLIACAEALRGIPLHALTRESSAKGVNRFWMKVRARCGLHLLGVKTSPIKLGRILKKGGVLVLMVDQHMPEGRGIPVPFFGRDASTTHAPAVLALATGAVLLPVSSERLAAGRHRVKVDPPIELRREASRQAEIERITLAINRWLEARIRARPDHWLWVHRRWKLSEKAGFTPRESL